MKNDLSRADILRLAAETGLDVRTVKRAVERGLIKVRAEVDRERLSEAAKKLKITLT